MKTVLTVICAIALAVMAYALWVFGAGDLFNKASQADAADVPVMNWVIGSSILVAALLGWCNRNREFD